MEARRSSSDADEWKRTPILSTQGRMAVEAAARRILDEVGVSFEADDALTVFRAAAGARVEGKRVRLDGSLVDQCLTTVPARWAIRDREGREALVIGEGRTYFGTADVAPFIRDHRTGEVRPFRLDDTRTAGRIIDALPDIAFACPFGTPTDVPTETAATHAFAALVTATTKPIAVAVPDVRNLAAIVEMAEVIAGGAEQLRLHPFVFSLLEPISPLTYARESIEKILFMASRGLPFFIGATVSLSATSPVTLAGALAQGLAEDLAGLVLAQLVRPGCPVGIGVATGVLDMSTGVFCFGAPEHALGTVAGGELARHLGVPSWSNGNSTQSKVPDQQAAAEAFQSCLLNVLVGTDVVYDCGYLESGIVSSLEMLVMSDEQIGMARRIGRGIDVTDETLAADVIADVGPGGTFLAEDHTAAHFRDALWRPALSDRRARTTWEAAGGTSLGERISGHIDHVLEMHRPEPLAPQHAAALAAILEREDRGRG